MLAVEHVYKHYGMRCAVADLSFEIPKGACVGFVGLNGAGKTTTLGLLSGLIAPTRGRIVVDGVDAALAPERLRQRVGYLPDRAPLYGEMDVLAYLRFAAALRGLRGNAQRAAVSDAVELCGLSEVADRLLGELSHGYRQRAGIAQAIVHRPALLVLDEPLQGLDPKQTAEMRGVIRALRGRHTVLLSTHLLREIEQTCDRILVLHGGRIAMQGSEAELASAQAQTLEVLVRGDAANLRQALRGLVREESLTIVASGAELRARIAAPSSARAEVSRRIVRAGLDLLQLQPVEGDLESVLMALLGSDDGDEGRA